MHIIDVVIAMEPSAKKVCYLCGRVGGYMIRFERWSEKEKDYALAHLDTPPPRNSVTCKKDKLEAKRSQSFTHTKMEKDKSLCTRHAITRNTTTHSIAKHAITRHTVTRHRHA